MPVITTLNFNGQTEKALQHYNEALDAETLFLVRLRDSPDQSLVKPGMKELIFHASFRVQEMLHDIGRYNRRDIERWIELPSSSSPARTRSDAGQE